MPKKRRRLAAWAIALALLPALLPSTGRAVMSDVYFTAVNEQLLEMSSDTMPFWSGGVLYVSSRVFEGTDLGVNYVRNSPMGLVMLYTNRVDLRFDLEEQLAYDKQGNIYSGHALERNGVVFFPLDLVCRYFGLTWSYSQTDTVPLIRVKSSSGILDDKGFIDAAAGQMADRYAAYEKSAAGTPEPSEPSVPAAPAEPDEPDTPSGTEQNPAPPVQAAEGQKIYLLIDSSSPETTQSVLERLGGHQATFLLRADQMENGDLLRGLVANGHRVALKLESTDGAEETLEQARGQLWQSCCCWLDAVWYDGSGDIRSLLDDAGCVRISVTLDARGTQWDEPESVYSLLAEIGRRPEDLTVYLGRDSNCLDGLETLLHGLDEGNYPMCAWRLTA